MVVAWLLSFLTGFFFLWAELVIGIGNTRAKQNNNKGLVSFVGGRQAAAVAAAAVATGE